MVTDMRHQNDALCFFQQNGWRMMRFIFALLFAFLISDASTASVDTQSELQSALNKNPDLKSWMAQGGEVADIAIGIDDKLGADPEWRDKPLSERFREVERLTREMVNNNIANVKAASNKDSDSMAEFWEELRESFNQPTPPINKNNQASTQGTGKIIEKAIIGGLSAALIILVFGAYKLLKGRFLVMDSRKKILNILLLAFVLMSIIPPWKYAVDWGRVKKESPAGYSFILTPPTPTADVSRTSVSIDFNRLLIQWAALGGIAALLVINKREES
ncbi:hypothetical protein [Aeromonas veronii]|uniref:hypothetical protein n=1 Tax=Aeromonas veronii TaxID=654 RepID=UPI0031FCBDD1